MNCHKLLLAAIFALSPLAASADESECAARIDHYLALNGAPNKGEISGVSQVGMSADEVATLVQQKGACATWQQLVSQMMRQHGSVLDGVEQMTGKPAPRR